MSKYLIFTLRHLGMVAFNSSLYYIRLLLFFFMLVLSILMVHSVRSAAPHPPSDANVMYGRRKMVSVTYFQFGLRCLWHLFKIEVYPSIYFSEASLRVLS